MAADTASSARKLVVMVTGCTEGGIGYELCKVLAALNCRVFATARRMEAMKGLAELGIDTLVLDVTSEGSIKAAVDSAIEKAGRVDILVNNAGVVCGGPLAEIPLNDVRSNFETNVFGLLATVQAVAPHMIREGCGKIVNVGSVVGYTRVPWGGAYCATKAAVHSITDTLRLELKPFGITVVLVAPGIIKSNLGNNNTKGMSKRQWSLYSAFTDTINKHGTMSMEEGAMAAPTFAKKMAKVILRKSPPAHFVYGGLAHIFQAWRWLPIWLVDAMLARAGGLAGPSAPKLKQNC